MSPLPTLYRKYDVEQAVAAFGPSARRVEHCEGHFIVLDRAVLCFLTIREEAPQTKFQSPTEVIWRPPNRFATPAEELPWLPADVRDVADPQTKQKIREHHVFVRPAPLRQRYVYVGPTHLGSYPYMVAYDRGETGEATFTLDHKLPRELWLALGGYAGWAVDVNHSISDIPAQDLASLDALLRSMQSNEYSHLILTRYEEDSLHLYVNAERGWLMYLREPADSGLYVTSTNADGGEDDVEEHFECTCGIDLTFPRSQTLPREQAAEVVREFFLTGALPRSFDWTEDF